MRLPDSATYSQAIVCTPPRHPSMSRAVCII
jgi:hypothetical protein